MVPELTTAFGLSAVGVASLVGLFYYAYAPFSLVAGVAMDQLGPRKVVPLGAASVAIGAILFSTGDPTLGSIGRFMQGAGGVFALIGAVYLVTTYHAGLARRDADRRDPDVRHGRRLGRPVRRRPADRVGPCLGPLLAGHGHRRNSDRHPALPPHSEATGADRPRRRRTRAWARRSRAMGTVFINPQSILCGLIAGLIFIPTTIFDMVWGVRFLQEAHDMPYSVAVLRSAAVPFGWIIGCPLLGWLTDRIGRRKPVIIGAGLVLLVTLALILYGPRGRLPALHARRCVAGIASGAAMIPYTVIKEANRPEHSGTATGVINFLNFSLTALLGPDFRALADRGERGRRARARALPGNLPAAALRGRARDPADPPAARDRARRRAAANPRRTAPDSRPTEL